jgi:hypothetical protein
MDASAAGMGGCPRFDGRTEPDPTRGEGCLGLGKVRILLYELVHPLAGYAEHLRHFGDADKVMAHAQEDTSRLDDRQALW